MSLLTPEDRQQLIANGLINPTGPQTFEDNDFVPVVHLYCEVSPCSWLLTEIDPANPDIAWGLIDAGDRNPKFGSVSIAWLEKPRGPLGIGVQRLEGWKAKGKLSAYTAAAVAAGFIVEPEGDFAWAAE